MGTKYEFDKLNLMISNFLSACGTQNLLSNRIEAKPKESVIFGRVFVPQMKLFFENLSLSTLGTHKIYPKDSLSSDFRKYQNLY